MAKPPIHLYANCTLSLDPAQQKELVIDRLSAYLLAHPNIRFPHRHSFYHLVMFTQGSGYHTIDFQQYPVMAGQLYLMKPGQVHSWYFEGPIEGYIVNFTEFFFRSFLRQSDYLEGFPFFSEVGEEPVYKFSDEARLAIQSLLESVWQEYQHPGEFQLDMIRVELLKLFMLIVRHRDHPSVKNTIPGHAHLIRQFQKLIETHYAHLRLPKQYADLLHVTANHLNAASQQQLGKPAGTVIRERILLEAKRLLVNSDESISQIAYQLNFSDNSYFTKFFRKYSQLTPEEFRNRTIFIHG